MKKKSWMINSMQSVLGDCKSHQDWVIYQFRTKLQGNGIISNSITLRRAALNSAVVRSNYDTVTDYSSRIRSIHVQWKDFSSTIFMKKFIVFILSDTVRFSMCTHASSVVIHMLICLSYNLFIYLWEPLIVSSIS